MNREPSGAMYVAPTSMVVQYAGLRSGERLALLYFAYTALLAVSRSLTGPKIALSCLLPLIIWGAAEGETRFGSRVSNLLRDWVPMGLILVAYWQMEWFATDLRSPLQQVWIGWDRTLLNDWHFRAIIESMGAAIPTLLEGVYLFLYCVPPASMAVLYLCRRRIRVDRYLTTLFLGTFLAYGLLPYFHTISPRVAFPGVDLPNYSSIFRIINVYVLDHLDITTSVFPSGHVAVAFSSAFGLLRALPERRRVWSIAFLVATIVYFATIYSRYHYAADGLASIAIAVVAWRMSALLEPNE